MYNFNEVEKKWQRKWEESGAFKADPDGRPKYMVIFAYPGVSGYLHVGHMRCCTYADVIARYMRMQGRNVLYPTGFHASGLPAVGFARKIERGDPLTIMMLKENGVPDEQIEKLKDPYEVVKFFRKVYIQEWKEFGFSMDFRYTLCSIDEGYHRFIQWQFRKLNEAGLLIQKPHFAPYCPNCGPVAVDPSETDLAKGGTAEVIEFTVIKGVSEDGYVFPMATLRPETLFGVTNVWVNPEVEYEIVKIDGERWILSEEGRKKFEYQKGRKFKVIGKVLGKELVGKKVKMPITGAVVPVYPATFVDPNVGTGVVMSVPGHSPHDYVALRDLGMPVKPILMIRVEGSEFLTKETVEKMGIKSQRDLEKLEEASREVYKREFHSGIMLENCGKYSGMKVSEAKEKIKEELISTGNAEVLRDFSEEVICRCGSRVYIKLVPDQWFIKYSDKELKEKATKHVREKLQFFPEGMKEGFIGVLEWYEDRACVRKGRWLGTRFPYDPEWIIEPISDSTLYPAYYIVSKYVNMGLIKEEELTDEIFDYVYLGRGKPPERLKEVVEQMRREFLYWYPVDMNVAGKEHFTVHLPVYVFNHVAILKPEHWPLGIFVNWWVVQSKKTKEKLSKSKGGAQPAPKIGEEYGVDSIRLYYCHAASPHSDMEWSLQELESYKRRIERIWSTFERLLRVRGGKDDFLDKWLTSKINSRIKRVREVMSKFDFKTATSEIYFGALEDVLHYLSSGGGNEKVVEYFLDRWVRMMGPFTPHIAEEMWEKMGRKGFLSLQLYPEVEEEKISLKHEYGEVLIQRLIEDVKEIEKVTGRKPRRIYVYVASRRKYDALRAVKECQGDLKKAIKALISAGLDKKEAPKLAKKLLEIVNENDPELIEVLCSEIDEWELYSDQRERISKEIGAEVFVYPEENPEYDPQRRAEKAMPGRPAIYLERSPYPFCFN